jgi:Predicted ribosomal protein
MIQFEFLVLPEGDLIGFRSSGHADYSQSGFDIVCAAVSSVAFYVVNTITEVLAVSPESLYSDDGFMALLLEKKDAHGCREILQGLKLHMVGLEEQYSEHIHVDYVEV